jgi:hypothetical protein
MADNNNYMAANLPKTPNHALKKLDRLLGTWQESGGYKGMDVYEWMEGGFFLIHHFDGITPYGRHVKGVEYVGFDEDTQTLRSHLMDIDGSNSLTLGTSRAILGRFGLATEGPTTSIKESLPRTATPRQAVGSGHMTMAASAAALKLLGLASDSFFGFGFGG